MKKLNKSVFILGLGVTGMSLAQNLGVRFTRITCWDDNELKRKEAMKKNLVIVNPSIKNFRNIDLIITSPGINHNKKKSHIVIEYATQLNIKIVADIELIEILNISNKLIGITGTNGKTTTTQFISDTLNFKNFLDIKACGNIGIPFTELDIQKNTILAIECSSFQLSKISKLRFHLAVLLNISSDHLDWHLSMDNYIESKINIFKNQTSNDYAIVSLDDKYCEKICNSFKNNFKGELIKISTKKKITDGIYIINKENKLVICNSLEKQEFYIDKKKLNFTISNANLQNLLATYVVNYVLKHSNEKFLQAISILKTPEHRMEFIGEFKNVNFFNDSKSTNVSSAKSALINSINIFWVLGGQAKEGGLNGIEKELDNVLHAFTFGESGKQFSSFFQSKGINCIYKKTLKEIIPFLVNKAINYKKRINIIFSPAASSYDQYNNFEERGMDFKNLIKEEINVRRQTN